MTGNEDGNNAPISQDHEVKNRQGNKSTGEKDHMTENQPGQSNIQDQDGSQNNTGGTTNPGQCNYMTVQHHTAGNQPNNDNAKNSDIAPKIEPENDKQNKPIQGEKPQEEKPPPGSKPPLVNKETAKHKQPRESLTYSFSDGLGPKVIVSVSKEFVFV